MTIEDLNKAGLLTYRDLYSSLKKAYPNKTRFSKKEQFTIIGKDGKPMQVELPYSIRFYPDENGKISAIITKPRDRAYINGIKQPEAKGGTCTAVSAMQFPLDSPILPPQEFAQIKPSLFIKKSLKSEQRVDPHVKIMFANERSKMKNTPVDAKFPLQTQEHHVELIMRHVEGIRLREFLLNTHDLSLDMRFKIAIGIVRAVDEYHKNHPNEQHLDIKPENLLISIQEGESKITLIDYAGARRIGETLGTYTREYMPFNPGTFDGKVFPGMDFFSLGMTLASDVFFYCDDKETISNYVNADQYSLDSTSFGLPENEESEDILKNISVIVTTLIKKFNDPTLNLKEIIDLLVETRSTLTLNLMQANQVGTAAQTSSTATAQETLDTQPSQVKEVEKSPQTSSTATATTAQVALVEIPSQAEKNIVSTPTNSTEIAKTDSAVTTTDGDTLNQHMLFAKGSNSTAITVPVCPRSPSPSLSSSGLNPTKEKEEVNVV